MPVALPLFEFSDQTTRYRKSIRPAPTKPAQSSGLRVLKSAESNKKIGKQLSKGAWRGMRLFTLTLIERQTCWAGCQNLDRCYGDGMPFAARYEPGEALEDAIQADLAVLDDQRRHDPGYAVRLHVLGDFYSPGYVAFWERMIAEHAKLHIWGYTHWRHHDPIGRAVTEFVARHPGRVSILRSDPTELDDPLPGAYTVDLGALAVPGTVVCPEQQGRTDACATCGLCMNGRSQITFIDHHRSAARRVVEAEVAA